MPPKFFCTFCGQPAPRFYVGGSDDGPRTLCGAHAEEYRRAHLRVEEWPAEVGLLSDAVERVDGAGPGSQPKPGGVPVVDTRAVHFVASTREEVAKWIAENVREDTRAVFIATDEKVEWWAYAPHTYDHSALANLRGVVGMGLDRLRGRIADWIDRLKSEQEQEKR